MNWLVNVCERESPSLLECGWYVPSRFKEHTNIKDPWKTEKSHLPASHSVCNGVRVAEKAVRSSSRTGQLLIAENGRSTSACLVE